MPKHPTQAERQATPAQVAKVRNIAKARSTERKAAAANTATLQARKAAAPPQPKPELAKGSGALIGVAQGATEGQPHTTLAVRDARRAAKQQQAMEILATAQAKPGKGLIRVITNMSGSKPEYGYTAPTNSMVFEGKLFTSPGSLAEAKARAAKAQELAKIGAGPIARAAKATRAATAPKDKATPAPKVDRTYAKGPTANAAKPGTWRHYMLETIMGAASVAAANAKHAKSAPADFKGKPLDIRWAAAQGYIAYT